MKYTIPSSERVREVLAPITFVEMQELAEKSGVPLSTIRRIRCGETRRPDVDCVRKLFEHLKPKVPRGA
jgi:predicted transcriptional regulator